MQINDPLTAKYWKNVPVLILGLGQFPQGSGISAAKAFAQAGAKVVVTDQKTARDLKENVSALKKYKNVQFVLGKHRLSDIDSAELIVANPRVRPSSAEMIHARKKNIPVVSDISLFLDRCPAKVVAVTGTRGKSTTVTLIAEMLKSSGKTVWLGGNILISPLNFLSKIQKNDLVVLELSSWQCESLHMTTKPPTVSVITNIMRDHLNTYEGMDDYAEAKAQIFRYQTKEDVLILNADDVYAKRWKKEAPSIIKTFGKTKASNAYVSSQELFLEGKRLCEIKDIQIFGAHNIKNCLAASLAALQVGATLQGIRKTLKTFPGLENRLEKIATKQGIDFINDTTATTPDGVIAAMHALVGRYSHLWFICGGEDKELEYEQFVAVFKKYQKAISLFLLPGAASKKIEALLLKEKCIFERVENLEIATKRARELALNGDAIVLSPGATSFGQFKNEFDRGETFRKIVKKLP